MQFKSIITLRKKSSKISFVADAAERHRTTTLTTTTTTSTTETRHGLDGDRGANAQLRDAVARERWRGEERAAELARHADGLRRLVRSKRTLADDLERLLAEEERMIAWLRTGVEEAHGEYVTLRLWFCDRFAGDRNCGGGGGLPAVLSRALPDVRSRCDRAADEMAAPDGGDQETRLRCAAAVDALRSDVRSLADLAAPGNAAPTAPMADEVAELARQLDEAEVRPRLGPAAAAAIVEGGRPETAALWRAVRSMYGDNRRLDKAARALERDTGGLQAEVDRATAEHTALRADRADKTNVSVALDEFCAVTGEMTALQARHLEFGRTLAVDGRLIAEELDQIERLRTKISKKQMKRQQLVDETDDVKSQLEAYKQTFAELERKKTSLMDDLSDMKRSPGKLPQDQMDSRAYGQRAKHLKQLKIQYNQLANTRDALKLKLQRHQQLLVVKTPSRLNNI